MSRMKPYTCPKCKSVASIKTSAACPLCNTPYPWADEFPPPPRTPEEQLLDLGVAIGELKIMVQTLIDLKGEDFAAKVAQEIMDTPIRGEAEI